MSDLEAAPRLSDAPRDALRGAAEFRRARYGHNHSSSGNPSWSRITYLAHANGYVMCRRPGATPFVITEKQWSEFPFYQSQG